MASLQFRQAGVVLGQPRWEPSCHIFREAATCRSCSPSWLFTLPKRLVHCPLTYLCQIQGKHLPTLRFNFSFHWSALLLLCHLKQPPKREIALCLPQLSPVSCYVPSVIAADTARRALLSGNCAGAAAANSRVRQVAPRGSEGELGCASLSVGARALWEGQQLQQKCYRGQ